MAFAVIRQDACESTDGSINWPPLVLAHFGKFGWDVCIHGVQSVCIHMCQSHTLIGNVCHSFDRQSHSLHALLCSRSLALACVAQCASDCPEKEDSATKKGF